MIVHPWFPIPPGETESIDEVFPETLDIPEETPFGSEQTKTTEAVFEEIHGMH